MHMSDTSQIIHLDLVRGSTCSEQNHSSVVAFIGKEFTGKINEISIYLLNRQCNLTKGFNKLISPQAS